MNETRHPHLKIKICVSGALRPTIAVLTLWK